MSFRKSEIGPVLAAQELVKPAVFIERDGVLCMPRIERGHPAAPTKLQDFQLATEALTPLKHLKAAGFLLFATTNQPGLSRGYLCRSELDLMHRLMRAAFPLDDILVCPHDEMDRCPCRKPKPGLLSEAAFKWKINLDQSFVISDKWQDAEAARVAGCTSVLLQSPWIGPVHHDFIVSSLAMAATKVLSFHQAIGDLCRLGESREKVETLKS